MVTGHPYNKDAWLAKGGEGGTQFVYYGYKSKLRQTLAPQKNLGKSRLPYWSGDFSMAAGSPIFIGCMIQYINNRAMLKANAVAFKSGKGPAATQFYCLENETWDDIVYLASNGYTIARAGKRTSFVFLDIDGGNTEASDLKNAIIGWHTAMVSPSTSRNPIKHHIIIQIPEIEIADEIGGQAEQAQREFRRLVLDLFQDLERRLPPGKRIILDDASTYYWQCLYSVCDLDDFDPDIPAACGGRRIKGWIRKYRVPKYMDAPDEYQRFIPSCPRQLNRIYGKHERKGLRLEWDTCTYGNQSGELGYHVHIIPEGKRGKSLDRLCMAKVYYGHYCNIHYGGCRDGALFTTEDAVASVRATIRFQFEKGKNYLNEKDSEIIAKCRYFWNEIVESGLEGFARRMECLLGERLKDGYVPRSHETSKLYVDHLEEFSTCVTKDAAIDLAYGVAEGDVKIGQALLRKWAASRSPRSALHAEWARLITGSDMDGNHAFPKRLKRNMNFRKFLKNHGIYKCTWI